MITRFTSLRIQTPQSSIFLSSLSCMVIGIPSKTSEKVMVFSFILIFSLFFRPNTSFGTHLINSCVASDLSSFSLFKWLKKNVSVNFHRKEEGSSHTPFEVKINYFSPPPPLFFLWMWRTESGGCEHSVLKSNRNCVVHDYLDE